MVIYKNLCFFLILIYLFNIISMIGYCKDVFEIGSINWKSLYKSKIQQIENEYKQGKREKDSIYDTMFFSLQDIDFNGIPELYHALISTDKGDYEFHEGSKEIYYIKNGKVVLEKIVSNDSLRLLPHIYLQIHIMTDDDNMQYIKSAPQSKNEHNNESASISHTEININSVE